MSTATVEPAVTPATAPADARQRAAALNPEQSFLVEAPAGSGKTGLLVQRLLSLLSRAKRPESVLALTFTNKATAEMRERVLKALDLVGRNPAELSEFDRTTRDLAATLLAHDRAQGWHLQANSHRLNIRTIDSLCGEIARSLPLSSGTVGQMNPAQDAFPLYRRAARAVMLRLGGDDPVLNDALRTVLLRRDADLPHCEALLAQMLATREQWGRLIPLTPVELTDDFLDREVKPKLDRTLEQVVCATLRELERVFPPAELHTLTHIAVRLAGAEPGSDGPNPVARCATLTRAPGSAAADAEHWAMLAHLLLTKDGWRKAKGLSSRYLKVVLGSEKANLARLLESLETNDALHAELCKLRNLPPSSMPAEDWRVTKALFQLLHFALMELHTIFRDTGTCDFTERSIAARHVLTGDQSISSRALEAMDLQHLLVDEMQDTSSAQYDLLEALTRGWDGAHRTVFLVGDPKQSIYLFRQARVERFVRCLSTGLLGEVPLTTVRLTTNFRSSGPLVEELNQLFPPVFQSLGGEITYTAATADRASQPGELHWQVDPLWGDHGSRERRQSRLEIQREQAEHMVRTIHTLRQEHREGKPLSFAVLVRAREHAAPITRLLREAAIPFRGVELERLNERPEVLDALAVTRALLHPADRVAWLAVLRAPWCGASLGDLHHLAGAEEPGSRTRAPRRLFRDRSADLPRVAQARIRKTLDTMDRAVDNLGRTPISELVERTLRVLGADQFQTDAERTNVRRYLELLADAEAELRPLDAADLQTRLGRLYAEPDTTPHAVDVMTVHKAKGLEWDVVFVPELQRLAAGNGQRLLDWLEVPGDLPASGGVLLAPIAPRGTRAAQLACYVQQAQRQQTEAELGRLLYVVVTRARRQLYLYAAPAPKNSGEWEHRKGSLLGTVWPSAGPRLQQLADARQKTPGELARLQASAEDAEEAMRDLSDRRRVSDGFDPAILSPRATLPWLHASRAETAEPAPLEQVHRPEGTLASRALGNAVHLFLDQVAQQLATGITADALLASLNTWPGRIRAVLRGMGTGGTALERDTATILLALRNTIGSPEGRWLLHPHPQARTEQALRLGEDDGTRSLRLDRSFLAGAEPGQTGTGTLWIVDYKTASRGALHGSQSISKARTQPTLFDEPVPSLSQFLAEQRTQYAPQLRNYAHVLSQRQQTPPRIMLALFYPLIPALDTWAYEPL